MELRGGELEGKRPTPARHLACAGVAKSVEMAKLHRARGQLEANSTLRGKRVGECEDGDMANDGAGCGKCENIIWKALELSAAAAAFAAWALRGARAASAGGGASLEGGAPFCPRAARLLEEFRQLRGRRQRGMRPRQLKAGAGSARGGGVRGRHDIFFS